MRKRLARSDDPVSVTSTIASASCGTFTSVAPQENSTRAVTPWRARYFSVMRTTSVAMIFPSRSRGFANRRIFGHGEHPAHAREPLLRVDEFSKFFHIRAGFDDPIVAGDARVERAGFDIASHFLRAHEQALDFSIVDGGNIAARARARFSSRRALKRSMVASCRLPLGMPSLRRWGT